MSEVPLYGRTLRQFVSLLAGNPHRVCGLGSSPKPYALDPTGVPGRVVMTRGATRERAMSVRRDRLAFCFLENATVRGRAWHKLSDAQVLTWVGGHNARRHIRVPFPLEDHAELLPLPPPHLPTLPMPPEKEFGVSIGFWLGGLGSIFPGGYASPLPHPPRATWKGCGCS